ncbi:hypothetical protein [Cognatilysobacter lacus]|uniref:Polymer-forming cytoskeletal protein n=1 Tax=Cognatilysobacter lacus TaxID=1643323 RepID=A0A5D8YPR1_9GAMM|nr:hypothetical protein [Lysobacter lacus]TZF84337.1 hypothetical protein FW784_12730 [Lysobacter lacus]
MRNALFLLPLAVGLALAGPVRAADVTSVDKVNGSIHALAGQGYGTLQTVNGSIEIDAQVHAGSAETVNGSIRIGDGAQVGELTTVNGGIHVGRALRIAGDVTTVNGGIFIDRGGRVAGGIENVNGAIGIVATEVAHGLETVNGDITVGVDSHVHGGIHVAKQHLRLLSLRTRDPRIVIGPNAQVDGALVFERPVVLYVHDSARIGSVTGATVRRFSGAVPPAD